MVSIEKQASRIFQLIKSKIKNFTDFTVSLQVLILGI